VDHEGITCVRFDERTRELPVDSVHPSRVSIGCTSDCFDIPEELSTGLNGRRGGIGVGDGVLAYGM
jgi:hypothetical protein